MTDYEMAKYYFEGARQSSNISTEIKAINVAISAIDKQIPKYNLSMPPHALFTLCPVCEMGVITPAMNYCPKCGDKLDWE